MIAKNAKEHLTRWDAGEVIWTIEMGGMGPGYEQAIQFLAIEIIRDNIDNPLPEGKFDDWGRSTLNRLDEGFSGAQFGAALQIAYKFIKFGPEESLKTCPEDRKIMVSNYWPGKPKKEVRS